MMECLICKHGKTEPGKTTITLQRNGTTILFKDVPAEICTTCNEPYVSESTTQHLLDDANRIVESGAELEIRRYAAA